MSGFSELVRALEQATGRPGKRQGRETLFVCPCHHDHAPSLSVREGDNGSPIGTCRVCAAGLPEACERYGLDLHDYLLEKPNSNGAAPERVFVYVDEQDRPLFEVVRLDLAAGKKVWQRRPDGTTKLGNVRRVLYRLPELLRAAEAGEDVWIVEGEACADALAELGLVATTNPMGAGKWRDEYARSLEGAGRVFVLPDDDKSGRAHAEQVARSLSAVVGDVRIVALHDPPGDTRRDVVDWLEFARTPQEREQARGLLEEIAEKTSRWEPRRELPAGEPSMAPAPIITEPESWLERASDLLAEPDPGPTPFLVDELIVDRAITAIYGPAKVSKTWLMLELALAIVTGRPALGSFAVPEPGPVIVVLEESGRAALWRRLDMLLRGNAQRREQIAGLHVAANRRVRLNDERWQEALLTAGHELRPRAIFLDPLVRLKGSDVDENAQKELGPVLDFMRDLRDASGAAVAFVHHVGHEGNRMRGSSDLGGYWESAIKVKKQEKGKRTLETEHREAEGAPSTEFCADFDATTRSVRLTAIGPGPRTRVAAYLAEYPAASANTVLEAVGGNRAEVLALVKELKADDNA